jgi:hypothetical protein
VRRTVSGDENGRRLVVELAKTSTSHYGTLLDGVGASIASRLNAYDAEEHDERASEQR